MTSNKEANKRDLEIAELRMQLDEANDTIEAIRTGQVDALILKDENGPQVYTLKSADQTYRVFIEKMMEGAVTLNPHGTILYSNSTFATMAGRPLSEVIGGSFIDFIQADKKDVFLSLFNNEQYSERKAEIALQRENGEVVPIQISFTSIDVDEGKASGLIITDLSTLKENEKQLKSKNEELLDAHRSLAALNNELEERVAVRTRELLASRERFKFLADNIPIIVWTANPNGEYDYFNRKWYSYSALPNEEDLYKAFEKVIHPDDLIETLDAWNKSVTTGVEYNGEYRLLRASDNIYRWHSVNSFPLKNEEGAIIKWFGVCSDVEEQKATMARKDEFISLVSHELKTPVTILKAFIQVLILTLKENGNDPALDFTSKMDKQINRLSDLIHDLLDATKVNAGELVYEEKRFDFNELASETIDQLQVTTKTHRIEKDLSATAYVYGDKNRLGQVISNLVINAIKYSPTGNKVIVSTSSGDDHITLAVRDFGIGIPPGQQSKLFNRFFRASEAKSNTFPGLGLGLYISSEIVKRHSGVLDFISEEGKGSTFRIKLPVVSR